MQPGVLSCRACWYELPNDLRREVHEVARMRHSTGDAAPQREVFRRVIETWAAA